MSNSPTDNNDNPGSKVQGEGDYEAARRYDQAVEKFAHSGKVEDAARAAKPGSADEAEAMKRAEREGKSHAKGEDPALNRPAKPAGK